MNSKRNDALSKKNAKDKYSSFLINGLTYAGMGIDIVSKDYTILYQSDILRK